MASASPRQNVASRYQSHLFLHDAEFQNPAQGHEKPLLSKGTVRVAERLDHVTWAWFTWPMATGGIALLLSEQPHPFDGLLTIGKVVFIFNLVLFCSLSVLIARRFIRHPAQLKASLTHPTEALFFPALILTIATIFGGINQYGLPYTGAWLHVTVRVLFWLYVSVSFIVSIAQYYALFTGTHLTVQSMTPAWIMPQFPIMLTGLLAAIFSKEQPEATRASMLVAGVTFQGLGFWSALLVYALFVGRLMEAGLPGPSLRPGMFIAVGPPSFTSVALITMSHNIPANYGYFALHPETPLILEQIALTFAIFIWALGLWFFGLSLVACMAAIPRMRFHMVWWAFVFPNTGFTIAVITIGGALHSNAIEWVGSVMSILLIGMWLFCFFMMCRAILHGDILWPGKDEDKDA